jgi:hypothetical protein
VIARTSRIRRSLLAAVGLVTLALTVPRSAPAHNGVVLKGWGTPTLDGLAAPGEWDHAAAASMTVTYPEGPRPATILVMNDRSRLYLGLRVARATIGPNEGVEFHFDNAHDGDGGNPGEDILRLNLSQGPLDMYYDPATQTIFPDQHDGGSADVQGTVRNEGSTSMFELAHPLDTADNAHDFSLQPGSRVGVSVAVNTCYCPEEIWSSWPPPGPWADIAIARALPTLALSKAAVRARWQNGIPNGTLQLAGETSDGAQLEAKLTTESGESVLDETLVEDPGSFEEELSLPDDLLPGRFVLDLSGTSDGFPLPTVSRTLELPAPAEGVVDSVVASASRDGPPLAVDPVTGASLLPVGGQEVWVRFHFAVRPKTVCTRKRVWVVVEVSRGKRTRRKKLVTICKPAITVTWYNPAGERAFPPVQKRNSPTVESFIKTSPTPLPQGLWKAVLRVGPTTVRTAQVRVA